MHKLNRKGYLTVEIVLASVVAFLIAFFLFDITMKLVDVTNDAYVDTEFIADKALIIKNIKSEIEKDICSYGGTEKLTYNSVDNKEYIDIKYNELEEHAKQLAVIKDDEVTKIVYGNIETGEYSYSKEINKNFSNSSIGFSNESSNESNYLFIKISSSNIFSDNDYNINIIINKSCN